LGSQRNGNGPFLAATVRERNAGNGSDWAAAKATALNGDIAEIAENGVTWVKCKRPNVFCGKGLDFFAGMGNVAAANDKGRMTDDK